MKKQNYEAFIMNLIRYDEQDAVRTSGANTVLSDGDGDDYFADIYFSNDAV